MDGFAIFHPDSLLTSSGAPQPYLLSMTSKGENILFKPPHQLSKTRLKHDQNIIEFEFSAIQRTGSKHMSFFYRLIGLSDDWEQTNQQSVRYSPLNPGTYTFELSTATEAKPPIEPLQIHFQILPPWWKTALVYSGRC